MLCSLWVPKNRSDYTVLSNDLQRELFPFDFTHVPSVGHYARYDDYSYMQDDEKNTKPRLVRNIKERILFCADRKR